MDEATPQPHHQPPFHIFRGSSFPLLSAHPCISSYLVHRSHLLAEVELRCCQTGMAVLACAHGVRTDQGTAVRTEQSAVGFSCHASLLWPCWKNRALLFLSPCLLSSCLLVCLGPVCLHFSAFVILPQPQISFLLCLGLPLSTMCSVARLQDCFWHCQLTVLGLLKFTACRIYHSSNWPNQFKRLSEIPFVIGNYSLLLMHLFSQW